MVKDLFNRPIRDLRISVTDRCNFRCPYCMPAEIYGERYKFLPKDQVLSFEQIEKIARVFAELGVSKIRLTGGEPLLRQDLDLLVQMLIQIPGIEDLALTTNGYLLTRFAEKLHEAGLKRITISIDTIDETLFKEMNGVNAELNTVLQGLELVEKLGFDPIKINTVVQKGKNDENLLELAEYIKSKGHILRFIEYMDVGNLNGWDKSEVVPSATIAKMLNDKFGITALDKQYINEVANRWKYNDDSAEVGFISSVSDPFCGNCSRIRLSTDGKLYTCLFSDIGFDLKPSLDSGDEKLLKDKIIQIWGNRSDQYSQKRFDTKKKNPTKKIEMYAIGG
ncbi:MAG: GTP 3',8-cyclase MoaA [Chloroflexi bacterium]|nr:GTP 3',8-cyclase MoaA [Chloroflexota bacterium]